MAGDCIRLTAVERVKIELGLRDGLSCGLDQAIHGSVRLGFTSRCRDSNSIHAAVPPVQTLVSMIHRIRQAGWQLPVRRR